MKILYLIFSVLTAMLGYTIHGSIFWCIMDFIFTPITWVKWIIFHEITASVFQQTFPWFFNSISISTNISLVL